MAEIKIEKKKAIWPWILLLLLIVAIAYYFSTRDRGEATEEIVQSATVETVEPIKQPETDYIAIYLQFLEEGKQMDLSHGYSHDALTHLADAVNQKAMQFGMDVSSDMERVKMQADHLTMNELETTHADSIRAASVILTNVLQKIQQANYPNLGDEMNDVSKAAKNIKPKKLTLDQKQVVKNYFEKTGQLLKGMN